MMMVMYAWICWGTLRVVVSYFTFLWATTEVGVVCMKGDIDVAVKEKW